MDPVTMMIIAKGVKSLAGAFAGGGNSKNTELAELLMNSLKKKGFQSQLTNQPMYGMSPTPLGEINGR